MRNGVISGSTLRIGISTLGMLDKLRVQSVLKDKYGLTSDVSASGDTLNIRHYTT